jgi:hypothetical protein
VIALCMLSRSPKTMTMSHDAANTGKQTTNVRAQLLLHEIDCGYLG